MSIFIITYLYMFKTNNISRVNAQASPVLAYRIS
ncbi:hypothetical protein Cflav_PD1646 [Pedosphaera parvula Ellin514]|uniref:Uncharacterized protein n=1 Tax=Pedosphaera parvula (strain Ellin514) TaxID=320771 RepID=B9XM26_PEDPL|nr:hypothetical protein Cflav_PD1646 [Pedosphaera parvula Ellin514]